MNTKIKLKDSSYYLYINKNKKLNEDEKNEMSILFSLVMSDLQFYAHDSFLNKLFITEYLLSIRDGNGVLVGFGNAETRISGNIKALHILSIYVSPAHNSKNIMVKTWKAFLIKLVQKNYFCLFEPLYITASAVNPIPMLALSRTVPVWPDFLTNTDSPIEVKNIAIETAKYYPVIYDKLFQVGITPEYAGLRLDSNAISSSDPQFDKCFYSYADPGELKLVLFVGRIKFRNIINLILPYKSSNWRTNKISVKR